MDTAGSRSKDAEWRAGLGFQLKDNGISRLGKPLEKKTLHFIEKGVILSKIT